MKNVFSDSKHTWQNASVYNLAYSSLLLFPPVRTFQVTKLTGIVKRGKVTNFLLFQSTINSQLSELLKS